MAFPIAGATSGLAATEVARKELSGSEIEAIIRAEHDDRITAAAQYDSLGQAERAATLRAEATALTAYL